MAVRVLLVPGVFLVDLPDGARAAVIVAAAISQLVAVIDANTPTLRSGVNPHAVSVPGSDASSSSRKPLELELR